MESNLLLRGYYLNLATFSTYDLVSEYKELK